MSNKTTKEIYDSDSDFSDDLDFSENSDDSENSDSSMCSGCSDDECEECVDPESDEEVESDSESEVEESKPVKKQVKVNANPKCHDCGLTAERCKKVWRGKDEFRLDYEFVCRRHHPELEHDLCKECYDGEYMTANDGCLFCYIYSVENDPQVIKRYKLDTKKAKSTPYAKECAKNGPRSSIDEEADQSIIATYQRLAYDIGQEARKRGLPRPEEWAVDEDNYNFVWIATLGWDSM